MRTVKYTTVILGVNIFTVFMLLIGRRWEAAFYASMLCYWCWQWKEQKDQLDALDN